MQCIAGILFTLTNKVKIFGLFIKIMSCLKPPSTQNVFCLLLLRLDVCLLNSEVTTSKTHCWLEQDFNIAAALDTVPIRVKPLFMAGISSLRGHVQCCPVQLSVSWDLCLSGSPHPRAPWVRCAASQGPASVAPGDKCRGHEWRRPAWKHHLPCQTLPVQPGAPVPARAWSGQVPEAEVPLVPWLGGAVISVARSLLVWLLTRIAGSDVVYQKSERKGVILQIVDKRRRCECECARVMAGQCWE